VGRATVAALVGVMLLLGPRALLAQDASDSTAYRALTQTPLKALAPALGVGLSGRRGSGVSLSGRYGLMSLRSHDFVHSFGIGVDLPVAAGRLGITAGYYGPSCSNDDCPGHFMASAEFSQALVSVALGRADQSGSLNLGLTAGLGVGTPKDATLLSGEASIPIALIPRMGSTRIFPFVAPGVGVGLIDSEPETDAGLLPTFAAGVGLLTAEDRVGLLAGISRVFLKGGNWLAGVSLTWNFGR
jgi:hypothetical protein